MAAVALLTEEQLSEIVERAVAKALRGAAPQSEILSTDQAAQVAGVSPKTIRNWIESGALPAGKRGRRRSIRRADLDRYLAGSSPAEVSVEAAAESLRRRSA